MITRASSRPGMAEMSLSLGAGFAGGEADRARLVLERLAALAEALGASGPPARYGDQYILDPVRLIGCTIRVDLTFAHAELGPPIEPRLHVGGSFGLLDETPGDRRTVR